jgi:nucleoside-diphosphate-sugar epimerase
MYNLSSIYVTGSSGFLGKNILSYFDERMSFTFYQKDSRIEINEDIVMHLAGKAHDLNSVLNYEEYYIVNTELTKRVFDSFLASKARVFITFSSVKAAADSLSGTLYENHNCNPQTHYGKSKLLAEQYILSKKIPKSKRVYVLRPCMIHGPGNKGNLNLLYKLVSKGIPWPLAKFKNQRSFCSIDNLLFIIKELIDGEDIPSGVYNIADDKPLSTNEVVSFIAESQNCNFRILKVPKFLIIFISKIGNLFRLSFNSQRLQKLTESYVVDNTKIKSAIGKSLPVSSKNGLIKTFKTFK